jgi:putative SOS response-associated peptidase YedK
MCYNLSINKKIAAIEKRFHAIFQNPDIFSPIYHASAFAIPLLPVITNKKPDVIHLYYWGLIPFWVKDEESAGKIRTRTFNARGDTIHQKPSYRTSIKQKRCLVIADGFFEWRAYEGRKYPYYLYKKDRSLFALAGIWDSWINKKNNKTLETFSVITTEANPLLEKIHNVKKRMPVILHESDEKRWLSDGMAPEEISELLVPYDGDDLEAHPVSKLIVQRGVDTNVPAAIKEFAYKGLPSPN